MKAFRLALSYIQGMGTAVFFNHVYQGYKCPGMGYLKIHNN